MNESESKNEKPEEERRFDPELLKKGLRCDLDQYERLKRCSDKKDMTEWNQWRKSHKKEDVCLEAGDFSGWHLESANLGVLQMTYTDTGEKVFGEVCLNGAIFEQAHLERADLQFAHLEGSSFRWAHLEDSALMNARLKGAQMWFAHLQGADVAHADLRGAEVMRANVDGSTSLWECKVNRRTNFLGVGLAIAKIDPGTKQLLEYNIRRKNWEDWYKVGPWWEKIPERLFVQPFWWMSNYGRSVSRIVACFFGLAVLFALIYWLWPSCVMVNGEVGDIRGLWHALYFSVVTMTTLGFGDIAANPDSWGGQTLLMFQVILGYVLLGALVTRFAVLFTAGGPAGKFAGEKEKKDETEKRAK